MTKYAKAIAAFVSFASTMAATIWGFNLSPEMSASIASVIGAIVTWIVPNKAV